MQKMIFIVDDNAINLSVAKDAIKSHYRVRTLPSAKKMFEILEKSKPDLILLDIEMPEMSGIEALSALKNNDQTADIPVIFLTALTDPETEAMGFEMGVVDFISKPFSIPVLQNRIKTHLGIDKIIKEKTFQLHRLKNALAYTLADMIENRDLNTGGHIRRTTLYMEILMREMVSRGIYAEELSQLDIDLVVHAARLHDLGKITISDTILNNPGRLTTEEYNIMKTHCEAGAEIIDSIIEFAGETDFLTDARIIAISHHERWDGKGYPKGLAGNDIPLQGRIMAVVDVYDALVSKRPYKEALSVNESIQIISQASGTQFDPKIVDAFLFAKEKFESITQGHG